MSEKRNALIVTFMLTAVLCAGCEVKNSSSDEDMPTAEQATNSVIGRVQEIRLKDGTRCVTWQYSNSGGLSCDWNKALPN